MHRSPYRPQGGRSFNRSNTRNKSRGRFQRSSSVDTSRFVHKAVPIQGEAAYKPANLFKDFGLDVRLEQNVLQKNYTEPTAIQDQTIRPIMEGKDVIGLANTGTGKTAAFVLPLIHRNTLLRSKNAVLIVTPTRELAHQVNDEYKMFARGMGQYTVVCVGGENIHRQKNELRRGVHTIIGTPGRLKDLIEQKELDLKNVQSIVLDEADQMLDMGFVADVRFIINKTPESRQVICFSATMTPSVTRLLSEIQRGDAVTVSTRAKVTSEHIDQNIRRAITKEHKIEQLTEILQTTGHDRVLVFGETKWDVQRLADNLSRAGHQAEAIHGNKSQSQRLRALKAFKENNVRVLVATDVAARGLDIPDVGLVVNFDKPRTHETYIHRIGRTGRAGKPGSALTFV